ncbi:MAG: glycoside hydrolase family 3 N-terminal domain-containing protein [Eubacteriales bacterium]|nr:glycoside hydrolase family 3 N-terminal domain-containing protein [Eubacteriales bacterium]
MKKRTAVIMALYMGISCISAYASDVKTEQSYTKEVFEEDGFIRVINPNGGATLSYSPDSGIELLEVGENGYTYGFKDLNRNGVLNKYEDWRLTPQERAQDLTEQLPIETKAGLMIESFQVRTGENGEVSDEVKKMLLDEGIRTFLIRNSGTLKDRVIWFNNLQALAEANDPYGIPVTLSTDPKNGSAGSAEEAASSETATSGWPSSLGLAATFDSNQAFLMGQIISKEYRALGIGVALSPQVDLATEPRWNRVSGTFGEDSNLVGDFAEAMVSGMQSSWENIGEGSEDLAWGKDSVVAMVKHFPGDGSAEAGRESHNNYGKYNVYPGNNLEEHLSIFERVFNLNSKTETAAAVMPSYSIAYDEFGAIGEAVGSGYSAYKLQNLLRDKLEFGGLICCDWEITENKPWGLENQAYEERYVTALRNGLNQFGGLYFKYGVEDAYETGSFMMNQEENEYPSFHFNAGEVAEGVDGEAIMEELFDESTYLVLENHFKLGLFEDPYLSWEKSNKVVNNLEYAEAGFEAQKASLVMLKNKNNLIAEEGEQKKTVYIPMEINTGSVTEGVGNDTLTAHKKGDWSQIGYEELTFDGALSYSFDLTVAAEYFNIVTDSLDPNADLHHLTEEDIIRRTNFEGVDFAIIAVDAPMSSNGGYIADMVDLDNSDGIIDNGYYAISLQYEDYYADPEVVRDYPIAVDPNEEIEWTEAGGERGRSRYYGGKTTTADNLADLELIKTTRETIGDLPMAVYVTATNPFCTYEFEDISDAIIVGFGVSSNAALEVLSGRYEPNGLLPVQMPANMETVEKQLEDVGKDMECHIDTEGNTYDFGYGMNWSGVIEDSRTQKYK